MAQFELPDEGVSFMDRENAHYQDGAEGTKPALDHASLEENQIAARKHDLVDMAELRQRHERARHE